MWAIWQHPIAKHTLAMLATSHRLNSDDRVSSFYWTRGSTLCFLTRFSYFSCYFLILVFLQNCYSLISFAPFSAAQESDFLSRFLVPLALRASMLYMHPHISGTERMGFLKQDAFRLLPKVSGANVRWANANHTFHTHKNPRLSRVT